jgi:hypothetical protein
MSRLKDSSLSNTAFISIQSLFLAYGKDNNYMYLDPNMKLVHPAAQEHGHLRMRYVRYLQIFGDIGIL